MGVSPRTKCIRKGGVDQKTLLQMGKKELIVSKSFRNIETLLKWGGKNTRQFPSGSYRGKTETLFDRRRRGGGEKKEEIKIVFKEEPLGKVGGAAPTNCL